MLNSKTIAVVIPAYNEATQILKVLESVPKFVDRIIVVNDCSKDDTGDIVLNYVKELKEKSSKISQKKKPSSNPFNKADLILYERDSTELGLFVPSNIANQNPENDRIILINLLKNGGVGAAIARGYKWSKDHQIDCTAVMAGDGQMDPSELESICKPVINEGIDYVKGNRLIHRSAWLVIPKIRYFGNSILSMLTKIASGYWHVSDTQTGYTAISLKALNAIRIHDIYPRYGMPNDMLVKLNIAFCTLREVEIKPVYHVGEQSKMKIGKVIPTVSLLLLKSFFKRLWIKYLFRDFHPLFLLYNFSFLLLILDIPIIWRLIGMTFTGEPFPVSFLILFLSLTINGLQFLLFAMWMDIQDNERLYK